MKRPEQMKNNNEILSKLINDQAVRKALAERSHFYFFHIYFGHHITFETAPFQKEMFDITENEAYKLAVIVAFRGSAKSTIISLSFAIWSIIGNQKHKFILLISQTQNQARQLLTNIRKEFETNDLLRKDFGSFEETNDEWKSTSLVLPRYGARITTVSTGESIRGLKHGAHRPAVIICDDIEDLESVKTKEGRDKTYKFLTGEAIPAGTPNTKVIIIGNLLHQDSVIMRFRSAIEEDRMKGIFRAYPLQNENNVPLWQSMFPTKESITLLEKKVGDQKTFAREYLLKIVADDDQIIDYGDIHKYSDLPGFIGTGFSYTAIGVDLAISEKTSADNTAFVVGHIFFNKDNLKLYLLPAPTNKRMDFNTSQQEMEGLVHSLGEKTEIQLFIEDVGYQKAFIQELDRKGYTVEGVSPKSTSKRERLEYVSRYIKMGHVLFPRFGAEHLIQQLVGFGIEKHDDLVDALCILIQKVIERGKKSPSVVSVDLPKPFIEMVVGNVLDFDTDWADEEDREIRRQLRTPKRYRTWKSYVNS